MNYINAWELITLSVKHKVLKEIKGCIKVYRSATENNSEGWYLTHKDTFAKELMSDIEGQRLLVEELQKLDVEFSPSQHALFQEVLPSRREEVDEEVTENKTELFVSSDVIGQAMTIYTTDLGLLDDQGNLISENTLQQLWNATSKRPDIRAFIYPFCWDYISGSKEERMDKVYIFENTCPVCGEKFRTVELCNQPSSYAHCHNCNTRLEAKDIEECELVKTIALDMYGLGNKDKAVCIVVKNGKVDNSYISTVSGAMAHSEAMMRDYCDEAISQIVVIKQDREEVNERMFEYIPEGDLNVSKRIKVA